jgi:metalloendopeptidase OMA1, mitochondrial
MMMAGNKMRHTIILNNVCVSFRLRLNVTNYTRWRPCYVVRNYSTQTPARNSNRNKSQFPAYVWAFFGGCSATVAAAYYAYLDVVPLTGRKRWIVTSPSWESQMGDQEYQRLVEQYQFDILSPTHRASVTVHRVGQRIANASIIFGQSYKFASNDIVAKNILKPYSYTVIRSDMANAFVLPGNHVFVMTGLFRYVQNEDELAIILGHEMAHNLARHMGEKLSGTFLLSLLARLSLLIDPSGVVMTFLLPTMSIVRELPNSRTLEIEADHIGLLLAADACYDPRAAKRVFAALKGGDGGTAQPPEFLSTHPSHDTRMEKFDEWTPKALDMFTAEDRCREVRQHMRKARKLAAIDAARRGD